MRSFGRWLHRRIVYPAVVRLRGEGGVFAYLRALEATQWRSPDELAGRQDEALAETLRFASQRVPYYREKWGHGGLGGELDITADSARAALQSLPFLIKPELQEHGDRLVADAGPHRVTRKTTGGSTGQAVTLLKDRDATAREMATSWLAYGWFGVRIGDRAVRFWGQPFTRRRRLRFAAADFAMHRIRFSAFAFDRADLERYWRRCLSYRPDYLYGYVSMLDAFATYLLESGNDGRRLGLKVIITTAEVLSEPQRKRLREAFGCPIQNEYGCGEVGPIAYECPSGAMHLMADHLLIELLGPHGRAAARGESGEVVVTDLANRAMPLVRYRLGDFAVAGTGTGPCSCGRGFPTLQRIWGREYDFVETRDGRRFHGEFFMYLFEELRQLGIGVPQFQVVQEGPAELAIALQSSTEPSEAQVAHLRRRIALHLGAMNVAVNRVDYLARARSGKMAVIVNRWRNPRSPAQDAGAAS